MRLAIEEVLFGILVGVGVGGVAGLALDRATDLKWINPTFQNISMLAAALLAFWLAEVEGGNGFVAAFLAGLTVGSIARHLGEGLSNSPRRKGNR